MNQREKRVQPLELRRQERAEEEEEEEEVDIGIQIRYPEKKDGGKRRLSAEGAARLGCRSDWQLVANYDGKSQLAMPQRSQQWGSMKTKKRDEVCYPES